MLKDLIGKMSGGGRYDRERSSMWTTSWAWRDVEGVYVGADGAWMYRVLPQMPLEWEDPSARIAVASPLDGLLHELAGLSKDRGAGIATLSKNREFHLFSVSWDEPAVAPEGTPAELEEFIDSCLDFTTPTRALFIGVKLWSSVKAKVDKEASGVASLVESVMDSLTSTLGEDVPDMALFEEDRAKIDRLLAKYGAKVPAKAQLGQLESWFNFGQGPDVEIFRTRDGLIVDRSERIEFAAVMGFEQESMESPVAQWALDATTHPASAGVVSIRGELQPNKVARARVRKSIRKLRAQQEEEAATTDIDKPEFAQQQAAAEDVENWILNSGEPIVTECSILFGRRVSGEDSGETYADELRDSHGILVKSLEWRQLDALDETMPCSVKRTGLPFHQDLSISMVAYAGLQGFTNLGDKTGVYVGLGDPDWTPVYVNPLGASMSDRPAASAILADSGSGKTFLAQSIATQVALAGMRCIFINPKEADDLSPTAELVGGTTVNLTQLEGQSGFFDPFRYTHPERAAELAATHILSVLTGFTEKQTISLEYGLKRGAIRGARCVMDALASVDDAEVVESIRRQAEASTLFRLGIASEPRSSLTAQNGLTLIQFDRKLDLPDDASDLTKLTKSQKLALATMRLVTQAAMEMLLVSGGTLIIDEAHHYASSSVGRQSLSLLGREGRSQGIWPILITQKPSDLLTIGLESFLSRVWCGQITDANEASAALRLCGLNPTDMRIKWLSTCGPDREAGRPAMFVHRDLKGRHAATMIAPFPERATTAWSTNPADRRRREAEAAAAAAPDAATDAPAGELDGPALPVETLDQALLATPSPAPAPVIGSPTHFPEEEKTAAPDASDPWAAWVSVSDDSPDLNRMVLQAEKERQHGKRAEEPKPAAGEWFEA